MNLASDILHLSQRIAELADGEDLNLDDLEAAVLHRDSLIHDCFAAPIPEEDAIEASQLIQAVLELDAVTCQVIRDHQQRIGQELGFLRRSHMAADAYATTDQD
jgi:hypothetical protein